MESWFGLFGPAAMPAATLARLRQAFASVLAQTDVAQRFESQGGRVISLDIARTEAYVREEVTRWTRLVRDARLTVD